MPSATIALIGALDTKGEDIAFAKTEIERHGLAALVIDTGVMGEPSFAPEVSAAAMAVVHISFKTGSEAAKRIAILGPCVGAEGQFASIEKPHTCPPPSRDFAKTASQGKIVVPVSSILRGIDPAVPRFLTQHLDK